MVNKLYQQASELTSYAKDAKANNSLSDEDIEKAKNAISSAFANSTLEEQELLQQYQKELDALELK